MKNFIDDNFLLETEYAQKLYHDYAKSLPIIDYHCHLSVEEIANDRKFSNLSELWIEGDHYKWRAMRTLGIQEKYITGTSTAKEKFEKWAATIPYTLRNPLYHWTHLELQRYFGITTTLNESNAIKIYNQCNDLIATPAFSARNLLKKMNVEVVCTTDDPADDLNYHKQIADDNFEVKILPTFRPDSLLGIEEDNFNSYLKIISEKTSIEIDDFSSLLKAIESRIEYFHAHGCRLSDHGLDRAFSENFTPESLDIIFKKKLRNEKLDDIQIKVYKSGLLFHLGKLYASKNWTMQLHLGPLRDTNTRMLKKIGLNAGVDSIGDFEQAKPLAKFLDSLNSENSLPKTILYNLNPADNEVMATMAGNFMGNTQKGKVQHGAAWWFLDQKDGIEKHLNTISNMGLISCFVGMLTDSRSLLSMPRHEYFRRILCNLFGNDIQKKELPEDIEWIGKIIQDICYYNAKEYFNFPEAVSQK
ncbi:glucuronate isomerase [Gillisia sp. M10.2A]|uniref:Uronate isomerase n=1 Tax=Gillisia lutea TaxID=2909668 RepID=A0ABS9EFR4_9FLAO|nr:glucuronate isomerase [Gillisia lutea]MCF4101092.1 glucuronate isomerase [Gillisia lutea]